MGADQERGTRHAIVDAFLRKDGSFSWHAPGSSAQARDRCTEALHRSSTARGGNAAEALAAAYLENRGLAVLARTCAAKAENSTSLRGCDILAVIEVRNAAAAVRWRARLVSWHKQRKIICATRFLLRTRPQWRDYACASMSSGCKACRSRRTNSSGSKMRFALLDDLQFGAASRQPTRARRARCAGVRRRIGIGIALRENHAWPSHEHRCPISRAPALHGEADAAETRLETDELIAELQHLRGRETHVQHDLAVFDILTRLPSRLRGSVNHDVRGLAAVVIHSCSARSRYGRAASMAHFPFRSGQARAERGAGEDCIMYLTMGAACMGSSIP